MLLAFLWYGSIWSRCDSSISFNLLMPYAIMFFLQCDAFPSPLPLQYVETCCANIEYKWAVCEGKKKDRKLNNKSFFCQLPARRSLLDESKEEVWLGRFSFNLCFWVPSKFNFRFVLSLFFLCVTRCSIYISLLAFSRRSRSESFATWCRRPPFSPFPSPPQLPIQLLWPGLNFRFFDIARRSPIP